jgi:hypothetical protein
MADLFIRGAANDFAGGATSGTVTLSGVGCDLGLMFISHNPVDDPINTVTIGGTAATLVDTQTDAGGTVRIAVYKKVGAIGNDGVVNFTSPLSHSSSAGCQFFNGTDQTTPLGTAQKATGTSTTAAVTVTSIGANNSGCDGVASTPSTSINTPTQTQAFVDNNPSWCIGGSHAAGNASRTFQWTITASAPWSSIAFEVMAAGAAASGLLVIPLTLVIV